MAAGSLALWRSHTAAGRDADAFRRRAGAAPAADELRCAHESRARLELRCLPRGRRRSPCVAGTAQMPNESNAARGACLESETSRHVAPRAVAFWPWLRRARDREFPNGAEGNHRDL